jgi:hypothetical protein
LEPAAARERVRSAEVPEKRREAAPRVQVAPTTPLAALGDLPPAPSAILGAVAGTKDGQMTKRRICALTGYAPNKSTVRNALSTLRVRGLIEAGDPIVLTAAGRALAGPPAQKRSSRETVAMWQAKITEPSPRAILDVLVEAYPTFLDRDDLAKKAGIRTDSSTFRNALSRLRVHGLVEDRDRTSRASEDLFPTGPIQ